MENPIIVLENKELTVESANQIVALVKAQEELENQLKALKENLFNLLVEEDIKAIKIDNLSITRVDPTSSITFDSARFKKEQKELYDTYSKVSERKGYVKIEVK